MKIRLICIVITAAYSSITYGQATGPATRPAATRPFTPARDTTVVTGPIRADGTIDYIAAINEIASKGVTPENNGAVLFLQALGDCRSSDAKRLTKAQALLGVKIPPDAESYVSLHQFASPDPRAPARRGARGAIDEQYDNLLDGGAWKAADAPEVAKWLAAVAKPLDLIVQASKRERFYFPVFADTDDGMLIQAQYPYLNSMRETMSALKARALLRLGSGDFEGYRGDTLAILRLSRLSSEMPTLVGILVSIGCEALGNSVITAPATRGQLTAEQCDKLLPDYRALPARASRITDCFDRGERFYVLDTFVTFAIYGPQANKVMKGDRANAKPIVWTSTDWNVPLRKANGWFDRLAAAGRKPTFLQQAAASRQIEKDADALREKASGMFSAFMPMEDKLMPILIPSAVKAFQTETRLQMDGALTEMTLALRAHHARTGNYPKVQAELSPKYFKSIPADLFTEQPLIYRLEGAGYVLYSLGPNGKDDGGITGGKSDDVAVRAEK